jgi:A/G-specific adenine glycosylase
MNSYFSNRLMDWHRLENDRQMPWKGEQDPYRIWLSEVILQQTRVEQGRAYYEKFISAFPSVSHLAAASPTRVFKLWEGLGYYSRCRNLIATAKFIDRECQGRFPANLEGLQELPGVGPYTAAAIASFAFGLPYAVVDGNVLRLLSRFFGQAIPIDSTVGRKHFAGLAQRLLDRHAPGPYNQAIMDLGATVCKARSPLCGACPLRGRCQALKQGNVGSLPVKSKKAPRKKRYLYYVVAECRGRVLVRERIGPDIWRHLHEFFLIEKPGPVKPAEIWKEVVAAGLSPERKPPEAAFSATYRQQLTHQEVHAVFVTVRMKNAGPAPDGYSWLPVSGVKNRAFPRLIISFLSENKVNWVDS